MSNENGQITVWSSVRVLYDLRLEITEPCPVGCAVSVLAALVMQPKVSFNEVISDNRLKLVEKFLEVLRHEPHRDPICSKCVQPINIKTPKSMMKRINVMIDHLHGIDHPLRFLCGEIATLIIVAMVEPETLDIARRALIKCIEGKLPWLKQLEVLKDV